MKVAILIFLILIVAVLSYEVYSFWDKAEQISQEFDKVKLELGQNNNMNTTTNIFNLVSGDFWDLEVGDNTINIAMVGTTAASRVTVAHYNRYLVA